MIRRALISVSNKEGVEKFCQELANLNIEIISTGGTAKRLVDAGVKVTLVHKVTNFPEMLDGRVKTLHPKIHGGILALRDKKQHLQTLKKYNIMPIDLVIVNLYPFEEMVGNKNATHDQMLDNIDIGGPALIRSAAKNYKFVGVIVDPEDYATILAEIKEAQDLSPQTRHLLAQKAFAHTAYYDSLIANYLNWDKLVAKRLTQSCTLRGTSKEYDFSNSLRDKVFTQELTYGLKKMLDLRYGENPYQRAAFYKDPLIQESSIANAEILQGKKLSYNNIVDADAALRLIQEFTQPAAAVIKHTNPCGVAEKSNIAQAFNAAFKEDSKSAFGGIVALNRKCTKEIAEYLRDVFIEIVLAPDFGKSAIKILSKKRKLRLLSFGKVSTTSKSWDARKVIGGLLVQDMNNYILKNKDLTFVTKVKPTQRQLSDLKFAWKVCKHVKSNAIVLAKNKTTVGIGAGQMSRIDALRIAILKANNQAKGSVAASDAFFPFRDSIDLMGNSGVKAVIQPGGSIRDLKVINAANKHNIAMIFTGHRVFLH